MKLFLAGCSCNAGTTEFGEAEQKTRSFVATVGVITMSINPEGCIMCKLINLQTHTGIHMQLNSWF